MTMRCVRISYEKKYACPKLKKHYYDGDDDAEHTSSNRNCQRYNDSGYDLYAHKFNTLYAHRSKKNIEHLSSAILLPLDRVIIGSGVRLDMQWHFEYNQIEAQVRPRSGLAAEKGLTVLNSPGTIDFGYTGEIKIILVNLSNKEVEVKLGERVAQLVFMPELDVTLEEISLNEMLEISKKRKRGEKGLGSTGI